MIIHRPHRGGLYEAMAESREFKSLKECLETLIEEFNEKHSGLFTITTNDICIMPYGDDKRVCWNDMFVICIVPYSMVKDKKGYERFFTKTYDIPLHFLGFISTDYDKKYLKRGVAE